MNKIKTVFGAMMLALAFAATGCTDDISENAAPPQEQTAEKVQCNFSILTDDFRSVTRAVEENTVQMLYFWLYDDAGNLAASYSTQLCPTQFYNVALRPGTYRYVCYANIDDSAKTPPATYAQALEIETQIAEPLYGSYIPMVAHAEIEIPYSYGEAIAQVVRLERLFAKIAFTVRIADGLDDVIAIRDVGIMNIPTASKPFAAGNTAQSFTDRTGLAGSTTSKSVSGSFYMLENRSGINPTVTTPQQRNRETAPQDASYLMIWVQTTSGMADYRIYLGEDDASDFNVTRNTAHNYVITLTGTNEADRRLDYYGIYMNNHDVKMMKTGDYNYPEVRTGFTRSGIYNLRVTAECVAGEAQYLTLGGQAATGGPIDMGTISLESNYLTSINKYSLSYTPPLITPANTEVTIKYTFTDQYGFATEFLCEYSFLNCIIFHFSWPGVTDSYGRLSYTNELGSGFTPMPGDGRTELYILDDYVEMTFWENSGRTFQSLYTDPERTQLLTRQNPYRYYAVKSIFDVYPLYGY